MAELVEKMAIAREEGPNPPSWMDRLVAWIDKLPMPPWILYAVALFLAALFVNLVFWVDGSLVLGSFHMESTLFSVFVFYWLALYHYLTRVADRSLNSFSPLLDESEAELARIKNQLTTLPQKQGWLAVPLGFGLAALTIFTEPEPYGEIVPNTLLPYVGDLLFTGFMMATLYGLIVRSIRQIRMVARLHQRASNINLLKLGPAHAFSALTARTGIGVIFVLVFGTLIDETPADSVVDFFWYLVTSLISIALFVMPILGMRDRLEEEKERMLNEIGDLLQHASYHLHDKISQGNYQTLGEQEIAIKALTHEKELLERASTWPWNTRTIRGFASALLLPILIWIVTRILERFL